MGGVGGVLVLVSRRCGRRTWRRFWCRMVVGVIESVARCGSFPRQAMLLHTMRTRREGRRAGCSPAPAGPQPNCQRPSLGIQCSDA